MKHSLLHLQERKNCPVCLVTCPAWGTSDVEAAANPTAGPGGLRPWGQAPVPLTEDELCFLSQKGRSWSRAFLAAAPQAGACWVVLGGDWAPSRDGQCKAGLQLHTCGKSWLQDWLFPTQKTKLLLELLPVPRSHL